MEDDKIIALYFERNESAITETKQKYGRYCHSIAYGVLKDHEDAEECENDAYLDAWNTIPPTRPHVFSVFLGTVTRRIALDRRRQKEAEKRRSNLFTVSLQELEECIPSGKSIDDAITAEILANEISRFLRTLPEVESDVFVRRYWHFDSIANIAKHFGFGQSKVKMTLKRTRDKLLRYLEKEGFFI